MTFMIVSYAAATTKRQKRPNAAFLILTKSSSTEFWRIYPGQLKNKLQQIWCLDFNAD